MAGDTEGAVGLTQILAETGQNLLGMQVDVQAQPAADAADRARARSRAATPAPRRSRRERRRVDERFDPVKALAGTARYLTIAQRGARPRGPRLRLLPHGDREPPGRPARSTATTTPSYARVYFDSTPDHHADVQRRLASFGDDSSNYLWQLDAAREIMRLYRTDRAQLQRLQELQTAKNSAEEVLHPLDETHRFADAGRAARGVGRRRRSARSPTTRRSPAWRATRGWASSRSGSARSRTSTAGCGRRRSRWRCTSAPRRAQYAAGAGAADGDLDGARRGLPAALVRRNREATRNYSLHTTGWAFDVARSYRSAAPGARVPVRARPAPGPRRDRLGARARRDPRHRRRRRRGPAAAARAARLGTPRPRRASAAASAITARPGRSPPRAPRRPRARCGRRRRSARSSLSARRDDVARAPRDEVHRSPTSARSTAARTRRSAGTGARRRPRRRPRRASSS